MLTLSSPDRFGNYWLSSDHRIGPVIFPHKVMEGPDDNRKVKVTGTYTVLVSAKTGFICDGSGNRVHYNSVDDALGALNQRVTELQEVA